MPLKVVTFQKVYYSWKTFKIIYTPPHILDIYPSKSSMDKDIQTRTPAIIGKLLNRFSNLEQGHPRRVYSKKKPLYIEYLSKAIKEVLWMEDPSGSLLKDLKNYIP